MGAKTDREISGGFGMFREDFGEISGRFRGFFGCFFVMGFEDVSGRFREVSGGFGEVSGRFRGEGGGIKTDRDKFGARKKNNQD